MHIISTFVSLLNCMAFGRFLKSLSRKRPCDAMGGNCWATSDELRLIEWSKTLSIHGCVFYSQHHNHGSGKWLYLKGNYYWRDPFFTFMIMGGRGKLPQNSTKRRVLKEVPFIFVEHMYGYIYGIFTYIHPKTSNVGTYMIYIECLDIYIYYTYIIYIYYIYLYTYIYPLTSQGSLSKQKFYTNNQDTVLRALRAAGHQSPSSNALRMALAAGQGHRDPGNGGEG